MERIEETDNFITICCDGIFDVMSNEEVVDYFKKRIPYKRHLKDLCEDLADYCCHKVSSGTSGTSFTLVGYKNALSG